MTNLTWLIPTGPKGLGSPGDQWRTVWIDFDAFRALLYADCDGSTAAAAFERHRAQSAYPFTTPCSLTELPSAPCAYVVCAEDQLLNPEWSRRTARHTLRAEIVELPGGHCPNLSRPSAVAEVLLRIADRH